MTALAHKSGLHRKRPSTHTHSYMCTVKKVGEHGKNKPLVANKKKEREFRKKMESK